MIRLAGEVVLPGGFTLGPLDLAFAAGERVLVTGPSGGGKSTLLRALAGFQAVRGTRVAPAVGFVAQDPHDQVVAGTAAEEVAFAHGDAARAEAACREAGISPHAAIDALSGGGVQRVVVAAARATGARVLVLDEPLAWLDPEAATALLAGLGTDGEVVVLAEHRTREARRWATREVALDGGRVVWDGPPRPEPAPRRRVLPPVGATFASLSGLTWSAGGRVVIAGIDLAIAEGERIAVIGPNGAGKTSLLQAIERALPGASRVPQDPDLSLFAPTVAAELAAAGDPGDLAARLGLDRDLDAPPHGLSRGQRLRLAVGAALAARPAVLLLDEPSAGQDPASIEAVLDAVPAETALVFATHDLQLAERAAHRVIRLPGGGPLGLASPAVRRTDPRVGLLAVLAVGILALALDAVPGLALLTVASGAAMAVAAPRWRIAGLAAGGAIAWSAALSQGLFYADFPRTAVVSWPVPIWAEGVRHGLLQGLRGVAPTWAGLALAASVDAARLHRGLLALGFPAGPGFLVLAGIRFAPALAREALEVRAARDRRVPRGWRRLRTELDLLRPLVARAVRRARTLGDSLRARGFALADAPRGAPLPPLSLPTRLAVALGGAGLIAVLAVELATAAYLADLVYLPSWRPVYAFARGWL